MNIDFNTNDFNGNPQTLIYILYQLRKSGSWIPQIEKDIEDVICTIPSRSLKYTKYVVPLIGLSESREAVFLKNPKIAISYLKEMKCETFKDEKIQKRFKKKILKRPDLLYGYAKIINKRFSEDEEVCFTKDFVYANLYARDIIKGPFSEKIHNMILLYSYGNLKSMQKNALEEYVRFAKRFDKIPS